MYGHYMRCPLDDINHEKDLTCETAPEIITCPRCGLQHQVFLCPTTNNKVLSKSFTIDETTGDVTWWCKYCKTTHVSSDLTPPEIPTRSGELYGEQI